MGRPARGTRDATKGLSDGAGTDEEEKLVGGRSHCNRRCGDCCGHAAVKSGWRDMRGGYTEEQGRLLGDGRCPESRGQRRLGQNLSPFAPSVEIGDQPTIALRRQSASSDGLIKSEALVHHKHEGVPITAEGHFDRPRPRRLYTALALLYHYVVRAGAYPCHRKAIPDGAGLSGAHSQGGEPRKCGLSNSLHEDRQALGGQRWRGLQPGAEVPPVYNKFLKSQYDKLLRRIGPDPAKPPARFPPIVRAEARHELMKLIPSCPEGREQLLSQTLPACEGLLGDIRIECRALWEVNTWETPRR